VNEKNKLFLDEVEQLRTSVENDLLAPLLLSTQNSNPVLFSRMFKYIYEIAETGAVDQSQCFDFDEMHFFCEAIPPLIDAVVHLPNSASSDRNQFRYISRACEATALYLELYESDSLSYPERTIGDEHSVAAILNIKVNTLKNIESLEKIRNMEREELKVWLEADKRFKPYIPFNSLYQDAPYDLSFIDTADKLMDTLFARCEYCGTEQVFIKFLEKVGLTIKNSGHQKLASVNLYGVRSFRPIVEAANVKIDTFMPAYNRACNDLADTILSQRDNIQVSIDEQYKAQLEGHTQDDEDTFGADELLSLLIDTYDFEKHPNDRGRNRKMSGLRKNGHSFAIERLKTPQIWVNAMVVESLNLDSRLCKHYPSSIDGTGRHSGLALYTDLATDKVVRIKLPNEQAVTDFLTLLDKEQ
jgi:gamma-glutamylcyclotransferase (GGCT)/AIG2-like uncharacterized protein YtfP